AAPGRFHADRDCGGSTTGRVSDATTSRCIPGCRGTSGNGCPSEQICTSTTDDTGRCDRAAPDGGSTDGSTDAGQTDGAIDGKDAGGAEAGGVDGGADGGGIADGRTDAGADGR